MIGPIVGRLVTISQHYFVSFHPAIYFGRSMRVCGGPSAIEENGGTNDGNKCIFIVFHMPDLKFEPLGFVIDTQIVMVDWALANYCNCQGKKC